MVYLVLALTVALGASANILMKLGMIKVGGDKGLASTVLRAAVNPWLITGAGLFVAGLCAYSFVLSRLNLSIAYPTLTSLNYSLVILFSKFYFKEQITKRQVLGFAAIIVGVALLTDGFFVSLFGRYFNA